MSIARTYARRVDAVVAWYLRGLGPVGNPDVESLLHFFVCWVVYFYAYALLPLALISLIVVVT